MYANEGYIEQRKSKCPHDFTLIDQVLFYCLSGDQLYIK